MIQRLVRSQRFCRMLASLALTAIAAALLYHPRLPGVGGLLSFPSLLVLLSAVRRPLLCAGGITAGLLWAHAWAFGVLQDFVGMSHLATAALFGTVSIGIALSHVGFFYVAVRLLRDSAALGAAVLTLGESALAYFVPWYEAHTLGFALAGFPASTFLLRFGGPAALTCVVVVMALYVLRLRLLPIMGILGFSSVLLFLPPEVFSPSSPGTMIAVQGLQISPTARNAEWHQEQLAVYKSAETPAPGALIIWPEGAYPFRERLLEGAPLKRLPAASQYSRIVGMHVSLGLFRSANAVVVQEAGAADAGVRFRFKQRLAPLYETAWLETPVSRNEPLRLHGQPLMLPVCYEILDRRYFTSAPAVIGISVSADSFDPSGEASKLLTRAAWLRAQECGCSFVRVSNGAYSGAFGPDGRALMILGRGPGILSVSVPFASVPRRCGNGHRWVLGALGLLLLVAVVRKVLQRSPSPSSEVPSP